MIESKSLASTHRQSGRRVQARKGKSANVYTFEALLTFLDDDIGDQMNTLALWRKCASAERYTWHRDVQLLLPGH